MLRGTSATEIMKKYKPKALERGFIAKELVGTKQGKFIQFDSRATQAHSAALIQGIKNSMSREAQLKAVPNIGGNSYAGNSSVVKQLLEKELDDLDKKEEPLTKEEKERYDEIKNQLK